MAIQSAVIIGSGNVATHLGNLMANSGVIMHAVYSQHFEHAQILAQGLHSKAVKDIDQLPTDADLYLIAVNDLAIPSILDHLPVLSGLIVHTSGMTPLPTNNKHQRLGVFYPLQSLNKSQAILAADLPLLIETTQFKDLALLEELASRMGTPFMPLTSALRQYVHLAAVFTNNFSNYLYGISEHILSEQKIPFHMLHPLILETARKAILNKPVDVQTGPALRNDSATIQSHRALLSQFPEYRKVYDIMTEGIQNLNPQL